MCLDDFIDDASEFENLESSFPAVRRGAETHSRHFTDPTPAARQPVARVDEMEGCDDFEKATMSECFDKLVRLRNDVFHRCNLY